MAYIAITDFVSAQTVGFLPDFGAGGRGHPGGPVVRGKATARFFVAFWTSHNGDGGRGRLHCTRSGRGEGRRERRGGRRRGGAVDGAREHAEAMIAWARSPQALALDSGQLESHAMREGLEFMRLLTQAHLDARGPRAARERCHRLGRGCTSCEDGHERTRVIAWRPPATLQPLPAGRYTCYRTPRASQPKYWGSR